MIKEQKDRGLKKAVNEYSGYCLPSNFTFQTMKKVEEAVRLREKKAEKKSLLATIAAAIFLTGFCVTVLVIYFGDSIKEAFTLSLAMPEAKSVWFPSYYLFILITIPFFLLFDRWMRKQYYKHHS